MQFSDMVCNAIPCHDTRYVRWILLEAFIVHAVMQRTVDGIILPYSRTLQITIESNKWRKYM